MNPTQQKEVVHYIAVFAVLAAAWTPLMQFFGGDIKPTLVAGFAVFVVADQLAHKYILKERGTWI
jgi:hypothetical protein